MSKSNDDSYAPAPAGGDDERSVELRRYAAVLLKHKWVVLATVAVVTTATVLYTLRLPKIYEASASMVVDPKPPEILGNQVQEIVQIGAGQTWFTAEYYSTQEKILQSRALARRTVREYSLHLPTNKNGPDPDAHLTEEERIDKAAGTLLAGLSIDRPEENSIFFVRVRNQDPERAAAFANAYVDTYIQYNLDLRTDGTATASKWLSGELDSAERELKDSESELYKFKEDNDILSVSLEDRQNLVAGNITRFTDALNDAKTRRIELGTLRDRIAKIKDLDVLDSPLFVLGNSETGEALKSDLHEARQALIHLEEDLGPKHPEYVAQQQKVADLRKALEREARVVISTVEERYQAALASENAYRAEVEKYKKEAFELGPKSVAYNRLKRKERHDEEKYELVLNRLRTSTLTGRLKTVNVRKLDPALVPGSPVYPRMDRNIMLAVVLSLMLGIGLAFALDFLDRTIKSSEDVEAAAKAPLLGIIPMIENTGDPQARDLHVFRDPTSRAAECCRSIRTNLLFMSADKKLRTLLISSANPREGKTTSVIHLGTTIAMGGQRVLLIDSDMRRPRLHGALGVARTVGLSTVIVGETPVADAIKTTDIPNLYVLPCGPTPPNPAELLMTERFSKLLKELEADFDLIVLDSPPILAVTDSVVLSQHVDGAVMVMKAGSTNRDDAARAARQLHDVDANLTGVILNELDLDDKTYGYYYHYYTYGYGYGSKDSRPEATPSA